MAHCGLNGLGEHLLNISSVPGTVLGAEDVTVKSAVPTSWELGASWRESNEVRIGRCGGMERDQQVNLPGR